MTWRSDASLYDQDTFCRAFLKDLHQARERVIIESPFLTPRRVRDLMPVLERLRRRGVIVIVNTKPFEEHEEAMYEMAYESVARLQDAGIEVLMTVGHHRKLAIVDDDILWEGSLNMLSQNDSCEIMRRIRSKEATGQLMHFIGLDRFYKQ